MFHCSRCSKVFISEWALFGHERLHISFPYINLPGENNVIDVDQGVHWEDVNGEEEKDASTIPSNETSFEELVDKCFDYLHIQRSTLSPDLVALLEAGYPTLLNKTRGEKGNIRSYFVIAEFINTLIRFSAPEADSLLRMMRIVTHMNWKEIPLPARYSTILDNILKNTKVIKSRVIKKSLHYRTMCLGKQYYLKFLFKKESLRIL